MEVVVIAPDPVQEDRLENAGFLPIIGDVTSDAVLGGMGGERAQL